MKPEIEINPNLSNFIKSLRDVGYTFEIAVSDIIDNSISANAKNIKIEAISHPDLLFAMLDDGIGMTEIELIEAMRLASKDSDIEREKNDLGRFGLGLKTASFSQCKLLTVLSKKSNTISIKQWDLDYISVQNRWLLKNPSEIDFINLPLINEFKQQKQGTLVFWQKIDRYEKKSFSTEIDKMVKHVSLVFHRFLEGADSFIPLKIKVNNNQLTPFNPFNISHPATQQSSLEKIKIFNSTITVQPFILPHHSKLSQQEFERYATEDGYTKSQGFYLYRSNRLLIYGTWWGLHKAIDAHKLVRIKIDISNDQDKYWGIDLKKSTAKPSEHIKIDLKRIIKQVTEKGTKPFSGRGKKIEDKSIKRFWEIIPVNDGFRFSINKEHPILSELVNTCSDTQLLFSYLKSLEAYLPLEAIQAQIQLNPHKIHQESAVTDNDIIDLSLIIKKSSLNQKMIDSLLSTEIFKNRGDLFKDLL